ncbi:WD repeat-containing protein 36 [Episyrphus balteatus]|uniref:WD repeat-containing protein 36 n=1 Tax=Episyrphus balteatus TaxID=286459 RepID=UPI0024851027|nr:WD repeat-containing protein 36 [Episyrphus balteatus]
MSNKSSKIFRRNRSLGYVSNQVPALIRYIQRRKDNIITTCIGRSFQVYTSNKFRLLHVSNIHPDDITCMANDRQHVYTAADKTIFAWRQGKHINHTYKGHTKNVHLMLPFRQHLIAIDGDNVMKVWDINTEEVYLEIPFSKEDFLITAIAHPPTYINKIILGSQSGELKLWNLRENRLVYTFAGFGSKVTCITPAPAIDVAAIGHKDGTTVLLNLKFDEVLMQFKQDWGPVNGISFRTDGQPIMVTTSTHGNAVFWNLEEKKVSNQMKVHETSVTTTICFPNEPLLLTTSPDNSMKLWLFDAPDGSARLLRIRSGHQAPPLCIRYHGNKGESILSSGEDSSLRVFSTVSETLNKSMGKASYNREKSKKRGHLQTDILTMPPIKEFTTEVTREEEWDNIAAIHSGIIQTTTWSFHKGKMGTHRLVPRQFHSKIRKDFTAETTCVVLTHCGNFVIIGYSSGHVERFNIQSGIHRASYGAPDTAHKKPVRGVACDNLNQFIVSGCSEGLLKFWSFKGNVKEPNKIIKLPDGVTLMRSHRESAMVCVAMENYDMYVVDSDTKVIVRKFKGHTSKINDVTFSPDSRWLLSASMDSTIKVWDIPSSYMIDHFKVERPCVSLTMSPTGDFLATAHVNFLGIFLWSNKMLFNHISLRSINPYDEAPYVDLPSSVVDEVSLETAIEELNVDSEEGEAIDLNYESPSQLSKDMITMSGVAESRWQNLLDLDIIKKRNKPKAAPKAPKQAPFFLPTVAGIDLKFDVSGATAEDENSKMLIPSNFNNLTTLAKLLEDTITTGIYTNCVEYLKKLGPSMIDFEIKSLHPIGGGSYKSMTQFLKTISYMLSTNCDFELSQAYLSVFLKSHGTSLVDRIEILEALKEVEEEQKKSWEILEKSFLYGLGVVSALRNYVI